MASTRDCRGSGGSCSSVLESAGLVFEAAGLLLGEESRGAEVRPRLLVEFLREKRQDLLLDTLAATSPDAASGVRPATLAFLARCVAEHLIARLEDASSAPASTESLWARCALADESGTDAGLSLVAAKSARLAARWHSDTSPRDSSDKLGILAAMAEELDAVRLGVGSALCSLLAGSPSGLWALISRDLEVCALRCAAVEREVGATLAAGREPAGAGAAFFEHARAEDAEPAAAFVEWLRARCKEMSQTGDALERALPGIVFSQALCPGDRDIHALSTSVTDATVQGILETVHGPGSPFVNSLHAVVSSGPAELAYSASPDDRSDVAVLLLHTLSHVALAACGLSLLNRAFAARDTPSIAAHEDTLPVLAQVGPLWRVSFLGTSGAVGTFTDMLWLWTRVYHVASTQALSDSGPLVIRDPLDRVFAQFTAWTEKTSLLQ